MWRQAARGDKRLSNPIHILYEYVTREWHAALKFQRRLNGCFVEAGDFCVEGADTRLFAWRDGVDYAAPCAG